MDEWVSEWVGVFSSWFWVVISVAAASFAVFEICVLVLEFTVFAVCVFWSSTFFCKYHQVNGRRKKNGYWRWINCGSSYHLQRYSSFSKQFENDEPVVVALLTVFLEVKSLHENKDCVDFSKSLLCCCCCFQIVVVWFFFMLRKMNWGDHGVLCSCGGIQSWRAFVSWGYSSGSSKSRWSSCQDYAHFHLPHWSLFLAGTGLLSLLKPPPKFRPNLDPNPAIEETS